MALEVEYETWKRMRAALEGAKLTWGVFKGNGLVGVCATEREAFREGLRLFGPETPFLVKELGPERPRRYPGLCAGPPNVRR
jgi:hypothetical protein